jgi:drug/metabolite transporter (DMT)-like permease
LSLVAVALLLAAGTLHAAWNLLIKPVRQPLLVLWLAWLVGGLLFLPVLLAAPIPRSIWAFVAASAVVEAAYGLLLTHAYTLADFSQVYPLARGTAPALLAVWAGLALHQVPSVMGLAGMALIVVGLVPVGGGRVWWRWRGPEFQTRGVVAALGVALCISVYSLIDGVAVRRTSPLPYTVAIMLGGTALLAPPVFARYGGRAVLAAWRAHAARVVAAGVLMMVAYALVLGAYAVSPLGYAGAVREVGVVIAALAGWLWLGESFGPRRLAGAAAVFAGILVLAFAA